MNPPFRRAGTGALVSLLLALPVLSAGERQAAPPTPSPAPSPSPLPARPITDSVERVVKRIDEERQAPCLRAQKEGVPCFPASAEVEGPEYSVAGSLRQFRPDNSPSPSRPPTLEEMARYRPGPLSVPLNGVKGDPVCAAKSLLKMAKGRNNTYYLYRVWNGPIEQVVMRDRPYDPAASRGPGFQFELLGKYHGECDAMAAWRRAERELAARRGSPEGGTLPGPPKPFAAP